MDKNKESRAEIRRPAQQTDRESLTRQEFSIGSTKKQTPLAAIRAACLACMTCGKRDSGGHIRDCPSIGCALHSYRLGKRPTSGPSKPLKAIRKFCLECVGSSDQARQCTGQMMDAPPCVLHRFRTGKNPSYANRRPPKPDKANQFQQRPGHGEHLAVAERPKTDGGI